MTVISSVWLILAITGFGFFSGGTTSLALSLVLLYGTGAALIVVIAAGYRLVNKSALKRTETAPADTAAVAFVGTARSATEELRSALRPPAATGRPQPAPASPRTVRPAAAGSASDTGIAAAAAPAKAAKSAAANPAAVNPAPKAAAKPAATKLSAAEPAVQKQPAAGQKKAVSAKPAPKSALNKAVSNKSAPNKSVPKKTVPTKAASKPAQGTRTQSKIPPAKTAQAKGRPANNSGSKSAPAKRADGSGDRVPGKKQAGAKDSSSGTSGPAASAQQICSMPAKGARPALMLASSNAMPQARQQHVPDSRKRAS